MDLVRCPSCEGFGWFADDFTDEATDCDWCRGVGYVYRDDNNTDSPIPKADYAKIADKLEQLDIQRLQEMGYEGEAKKPWQQDIRKGTKGGENPYETPEDCDDTAQ
ncbi:MAG: hypothetical protein ACPG7F_08855 [Aggregatilineales bacterium]